MNDIQGILPLWKEAGLTSHDCVNQVRRLFGLKKVGHGGTLDPDVSGVLPIALGKATKVLEYMLDGDKIYQGTISFGRSTTTEDASGETVETAAVPSNLTREIVESAMKEFLGSIEQTPPMYSAVRVNGRHLYEYAREGIQIDRPSRQVEIYEWITLSDLYFNQLNELSIDFQVKCSKGTYIRTLAVDLGKALGLPSHMSALKRVQAGGINETECVTIKELREIANELTPNELASKYLLPLERALDHLPHLEIDQQLYNQVKNGARLDKSIYPEQEYPLVLIYGGYAVAIYEPHSSKEDLMKPKKVLRQDLGDFNENKTH